MVCSRTHTYSFTGLLHFKCSVVFAYHISIFSFSFNSKHYQFLFDGLSVCLSSLLTCFDLRFIWNISFNNASVATIKRRSHSHCLIITQPLKVAQPLCRITADNDKMFFSLHSPIFFLFNHNKYPSGNFTISKHNFF